MHNKYHSGVYTRVIFMRTGVKGYAHDKGNLISLISNKSTHLKRNSSDSAGNQNEAPGRSGGGGEGRERTGRKND